jgi:hypothetical protein
MHIIKEIKDFKLLGKKTKKWLLISQFYGLKVTVTHAWLTIEERKTRTWIKRRGWICENS